MNQEFTGALFVMPGTVESLVIRMLTFCFYYKQVIYKNIPSCCLLEGIEREQFNYYSSNSVFLIDIKAIFVAISSVEKEC